MRRSKNEPTMNKCAHGTSSSRGRARLVVTIACAELSLIACRVGIAQAADPNRPSPSVPAASAEPQCDIRRVDWGNFPFPAYKLSRGSYAFPETQGTGGGRLDAAHIVYADLNKNGKLEAFVPVDLTGGDWGGLDLTVFESDGDCHPRVVFQTNSPVYSAHAGAVVGDSYVYVGKKKQGDSEPWWRFELSYAGGRFGVVREGLLDPQTIAADGAAAKRTCASLNGSTWAGDIVGACQNASASPDSRCKDNTSCAALIALTKRKCQSLRDQAPDTCSAYTRPRVVAPPADASACTNGQGATVPCPHPDSSQPAGPDLTTSRAGVLCLQLERVGVAAGCAFYAQGGTLWAGALSKVRFTAPNDVRKRGDVMTFADEGVVNVLRDNFCDFTTLPGEIYVKGGTTIVRFDSGFGFSAVQTAQRTQGLVPLFERTHFFSDGHCRMP